LEVPVLKSKGLDTDRFANAKFAFNRMRALLLSQVHIAVFVGGSHNSGKSTTAFRLYEAIQKLIYQAIENGPLEYGDVKVGLCDLDVVSRTSYYLAQRRAPLRGPKRGFTEDRTEDALLELDRALATYNIVIVDGPGKRPDQRLRRLAQRCHYSILVDRMGSEDRPNWQRFARGDDVPQHLIDISTIMGADRSSGLIRYDSTQRGRVNDFMWARLANLKRDITEDPVIDLIAHVLLYDYLPTRISEAWEQREHYLTIAGERSRDYNLYTQAIDKDD
jgi:hypothetical protein